MVTLVMTFTMYLGRAVRGQLPVEIPEQGAERVLLGDLMDLIQYEQADHA